MPSLNTAQLHRGIGDWPWRQLGRIADVLRQACQLIEAMMELLYFLFPEPGPFHAKLDEILVRVQYGCRQATILHSECVFLPNNRRLESTGTQTLSMSTEWLDNAEAALIQNLQTMADLAEP